MGEIYCLGSEDVPKDLTRSLFYFEAAAEAIPDRQKHFTEARAHFKKGADADNPECKYHLAQLLATENGGGMNLPLAISLLQESATNGYVPAMNELGMRLQRGDGIEKNAITAIGWFLAGAERNDPAAATNLGLCYSRGICVPVNYDRAGSLYAKAGSQNYTPALFLLGGLFENGHGTEANPVLAYANYSRAAALGHPLGTKARDALAPTLSPELLEEAKKQLAPPESGNKPANKDSQTRPGIPRRPPSHARSITCTFAHHDLKPLINTWWFGSS